MSAMLDLLSRRRSIPAARLGKPGPDQAAIDKLLTIAARVPDHAKLTPWRFVIYPSAAGAEIGDWLAARLKARQPGAPEAQVALTRSRFGTAPLVVGVIHRPRPDHPKAPEWEQHLSVGAACMNLIVAAHAMGYAANWITEWYAYDAEAAAYLGAAEGERFAGFIHIGTPLDPPSERDRPALETIVTTWVGAAVVSDAEIETETEAEAEAEAEAEEEVATEAAPEVETASGAAPAAEPEGA